MTHPVFISYARKASLVWAEGLHRVLGAENGLSFLDSSDIAPAERIPRVLFEALLASKVVVVFADATYFTRRYCREELEVALAAFDALRARGASEDVRDEALAPVIVALPADEPPPQDLERILERLPPTIAQTNWRRADQTADLAALVQDRLQAVERTLRERLHGLGVDEDLYARVHGIGVPMPRHLGGVRVYPVSAIPASLQDGFVDREEDLWGIHRALSTRRGEATVAALTGALEGGGGFGKTRLAAEYLHRYGPSTYPGGLFWITAEVPGDPEGDAQAHAKRLESHLEEQFHGILRTLRTDVPELKDFRESGRDAYRELGEALQALSPAEMVLYIVDNVPEPPAGQPARALSTWCPAVGLVSLLLTSRSKLSLAESVQPLSVDVLPDAAARDLLTTGLGAQRSALSEPSWGEIASWVGNLPLALELLNRALRAGVSPHALIERALADSPAAELDRQADILRLVVPAAAARGITEALDVSYQRLPPGVRRLARLLAWLAPEPIPDVMFDALQDEVPADEGRAILVARSFITPMVEGGVAVVGRMHRVLASFLRLQPSADEDFAAVRRSLAELMAPSVVEDPAHWPLMNACIPHAEWVYERIERSGIASEDEAVDAIQLLLQVAVLLREQGLYRRAQSLEERVLPFVERELGEEHQLVDVPMQNLAMTMLERQEPEQARKLQARVVESRTRRYGPDDELTLTARGNLAEMIRQDGDAEGALREAEAILDIVQSGSSEAFSNRNTRALALRDLERAAEARDELLALVNEAGRGLGADHINTLKFMNNLGDVLMTLEQYEDALKIHEQVLANRRARIGPAHPHTILSMHNEIICLYALGRREEARVLVGDVVEALVNGPGAHDPDALRGLEQLLLLLTHLWNDPPAARVVGETVLGAQTKLFGVRDPRTVQTAWTLAAVLNDLGDRPAMTHVFASHLLWLAEADPGTLNETLLEVRERVQESAVAGRRAIIEDDSIVVPEDSEAELMASIDAFWKRFVDEAVTEASEGHQYLDVVVAGALVRRHPAAAQYTMQRLWHTHLDDPDGPAGTTAALWASWIGAAIVFAFGEQEELFSLLELSNPGLGQAIGDVLASANR